MRELAKLNNTMAAVRTDAHVAVELPGNANARRHPPPLMLGGLQLRIKRLRRIRMLMVADLLLA